MNKELKIIISAFALIGTVVGGYVFVEDRVDAKVSKTQEDVEEKVKELKENTKEKNGKQDEEIKELEDFSYRQGLLLERIAGQLDAFEMKK